MAEQNLTESSSRHQFSRTSLLAFKAQVFMHLNRNKDANDVLDELVDSKVFSLTTNRKDWRNLFLNDEARFPGEGETGPELIMSIRYDFEEDGNRASGIYATFFPGVPSYWVAPKLVQEWEEKFSTDSTAWVTKYPGVDPHIIEINEDSGEQ